MIRVGRYSGSGMYVGHLNAHCEIMNGVLIWTMDDGWFCGNTYSICASYLDFAGNIAPLLISPQISKYLYVSLVVHENTVASTWLNQLFSTTGRIRIWLELATCSKWLCRSSGSVSQSELTRAAEYWYRCRYPVSICHRRVQFCAWHGLPFPK